MKFTGMLNKVLLITLLFSGVSIFAQTTDDGGALAKKEKAPKSVSDTTQAKVDKVKASYVDSCNYQRYLAKKSLQEKFFSASLKEIKIGYK